jgi:hypothetical protein
MQKERNNKKGPKLMKQRQNKQTKPKTTTKNKTKNQ